MPVKAIVTGQKVREASLQRSRELRREMTPAEKLLWHALRRNNLGGNHFRRQQIIEGYIVDFYCHQASLVVEVDGPIHEQQKEYDAERDRVFEELGLMILHLTNEEVIESLPVALKKIQGVLKDGVD